MSEKPQALVAFILDEGKKWLARTSIMAVVALIVLVFAPFSDRIKAIWASPDLLHEVIQKLDALRDDVNRATGEDRVIFEAPGQSYVREPVHVGEQITLNMVVRHTTLGAQCYMLNRTAIFTDETGVSNAGPVIKPARQLSASETQIPLSLDVPAQVRTGRVTVYVALEFDCGGETVFDATRPVAFMLLAPLPEGPAP